MPYVLAARKFNGYLQVHNLVKLFSIVLVFYYFINYNFFLLSCSHELLEAIEQERSIRSNRTQNAANSHRTSLQDLNLQQVSTLLTQPRWPFPLNYNLIGWRLRATIGFFSI